MKNSMFDEYLRKIVNHPSPNIDKELEWQLLAPKLKSKKSKRRFLLWYLLPLLLLVGGIMVYLYLDHKPTIYNNGSTITENKLESNESISSNDVYYSKNQSESRTPQENTTLNTQWLISNNVEKENSNNINLELTNTTAKLMTAHMTSGPKNSSNTRVDVLEASPINQNKAIDDFYSLHTLQDIASKTDLYTNKQSMDLSFKNEIVNKDSFVALSSLPCSNIINPIQSLNKDELLDHKLDFSELPTFIESENNYNEAKANYLTNCITGNIYYGKLFYALPSKLQNNAVILNTEKAMDRMAVEILTKIWHKGNYIIQSGLEVDQKTVLFRQNFRDTAEINLSGQIIKEVVHADLSIGYDTGTIRSEVYRNVNRKKYNTNYSINLPLNFQFLLHLNSKVNISPVLGFYLPIAEKHIASHVISTDKDFDLKNSNKNFTWFNHQCSFSVGTNVVYHINNKLKIPMGVNYTADLGFRKEALGNYKFQSMNINAGLIYSFNKKGR